MIDRRGATVSLLGDLRIVPTARRPGSRLAVIAAAHVVACWPETDVPNCQTNV